MAYSIDCSLPWLLRIALVFLIAGGFGEAQRTDLDTDLSTGSDLVSYISVTLFVPPSGLSTDDLLALSSAQIYEPPDTV